MKLIPASKLKVGMVVFVADGHNFKKVRIDEDNIDEMILFHNCYELDPLTLYSDEELEDEIIKRFALTGRTARIVWVNATLDGRNEFDN